MSNLTLERIVLNSSTKSNEICSPVTEEFIKLFERSEEKLKADLNEYSKAYLNASNFYVK